MTVPPLTTALMGPLPDLERAEQELGEGAQQPSSRAVTGQLVVTADERRYLGDG